MNRTDPVMKLAGGPAPIDMVLHCPACGLQHIDAPKETDPTTWTEDSYGIWNNPPHRSHLCHGCGHQWRPADVPTNGVAAVKTRGQNDSPIVQPRRADEIHEAFDTTTEAGRWQAESASYAIEALRQIVPDVKPRDDDAVLMSMSQVERLMRYLGWVSPSEGRKPAGVVSQEPYRPHYALPYDWKITLSDDWKITRRENGDVVVTGPIGGLTLTPGAKGARLADRLLIGLVYALTRATS